MRRYSPTLPFKLLTDTVVEYPDSDYHNNEDQQHKTDGKELEPAPGAA
jgi:hypothetical protein